MLADDTLLDTTTIKTINENGHSRIPVYRGERENIVGVLFVKSLLELDPEDGEPISKYMKSPVHRLVPNLCSH